MPPPYLYLQLHIRSPFPKSRYPAQQRDSRESQDHARITRSSENSSRGGNGIAKSLLVDTFLQSHGIYRHVTQPQGYLRL